MDLYGGTSDDSAQKSFECPTCGADQAHDDDFCHDCGHSFEWAGAHGSDDDFGGEVRGEQCPVCPSGEIQDLDDGIRQCDSCGYTARDWSTA